MKVVILLSGGQDSTTSLLWALNRFDSVHAIIFDYGQKHRVEIESALKTADFFEINADIIKLPEVFANSALIDGGDVNDSSDFNEDLPASFVPGRNMVFLSLASSWALARGFEAVITGVCETDYSGYPDCRAVFVESMKKTIMLAVGKNFQIYTPLMYIDKAETWQLAKHEGHKMNPVFDGVKYIVENTHTDYNGDRTPNDWGYGKEDNAASILRAEGFRKAKKLGWI